MNKLILIAFTLLTGLLAQAQTPVTETRKVAPFTKLDVGSAIEVIVSQGENQAIRVIADSKNSLESVVTESNGNTLKISMKNNNGKQHRIKVYIACSELNGIKAVTGAYVKTEGELETSGLAISLGSGAYFKGYIVAHGAVRLDAATGSVFEGIVLTDNFYGHLKNGAVVKIAGSTNNATITATAGATCLASNFKCNSANVDARSTSSIVINVNDKIYASADETASVTYYGQPATAMLGDDSYAIKRNR